MTFPSGRAPVTERGLNYQHVYPIPPIGAPRVLILTAFDLDEYGYEALRLIAEGLTVAAAYESGLVVPQSRPLLLAGVSRDLRRLAATTS